MQLQEPTYICEYCGQSFTRRRPIGRRPLYCRRTCRQRAYELRTLERRRPVPRLPLPARYPPEPGPPRYQLGLGGRYGEITHALRPAAVPDGRGRRPTVCGAYVLAGRGYFVPGYRRTCKTCASVTEVFPLNRTPQPEREHPFLVDRIRRAADRAAALFSEVRHGVGDASSALGLLAEQLDADRRTVEHEANPLRWRGANSLAPPGALA